MLRNRGLTTQLVFSFLLVIVTAAACYPFSGIIGYRAVALILLVAVSLNSMLFVLPAVFLSAASSALVWNFFFIPPKFTFSIHSTEDALLFLMYFVIALINGILTAKVRQIERAEQQREERDNSLKLYNTLFNSLSHELRTPISTIIGATDNLIRLDEKLTEHNKYELLSEVAGAAMRLNRQVNNLLNMSRLESGHIRLRPEWIDLPELVHGVIDQLEDVLKGRPVSVQTADNLPLVKQDQALLEQVLYNLLHNAATYISRYAVITVRVGLRAGNIHLVVEDTGPGIPDDELDNVFDKFYRLRQSQPGGTGLGLSIVKGFVDAMKGTVTVRNMPDGGAVFTLDIPAELSYVQVEKR